MLEKKYYYMFIKREHSQTCVQRPSLGPKNSGRCSEIIYVIKVLVGTSK
jgi:hypothetical protein